VVPTDVADYDQVDAASDRIESELGPIDCWVNNAMTTTFARIRDLEAHEIARATNVTYLGQTNGALAALKRMRPPGARSTDSDCRDASSRARPDGDLTSQALSQNTRAARLAGGAPNAGYGTGGDSRLRILARRARRPSTQSRRSVALAGPMLQRSRQAAMAAQDNELRSCSRRENSGERRQRPPAPTDTIIGGVPGSLVGDRVHRPNRGVPCRISRPAM
jgi:hypothetical protein